MSQLLPSGNATVPQLKTQRKGGIHVSVPHPAEQLFDPSASAAQVMEIF